MAWCGLQATAAKWVGGQSRRHLVSPRLSVSALPARLALPWLRSDWMLCNPLRAGLEAWGVPLRGWGANRQQASSVDRLPNGQPSKASRETKSVFRFIWCYLRRISTAYTNTVHVTSTGAKQPTHTTRTRGHQVQHSIHALCSTRAAPCAHFLR